MNTQTKALVLLSGGLDSMLAAKMLQTQGIEVVGVSFKSNFFNCEKARKAAEELGIELIEIDISKKLLEVVKNPPSGYGKHLNPCIDCHALMIKVADKYIKGKVANTTGSFASAQDDNLFIIATGEVLGQRPMSQNRDSLELVKKLSGVDVLRPLSAKKLAETEAEKKGLVIRGKLKNISGRSREEQIELTKKYNIVNYASPGGGCLLTDPEFSERLVKILSYWPECDVGDLELLKNGRVFWLKSKNNNILVIIGRHKEENENLEKSAKKNDIILELEDIMGPTALIRAKSSSFIDLLSEDNINKEIEIPKKLKMSELKLGEEKNEKEIIKTATILTGYYATKARGKKVKFNYILKV